MTNQTINIIPDYRFQTNLKRFLIGTGFCMAVTPYILSNYHILTFLGLILFVAGVFYHVLSSKERLTIYEDMIVYEAKGVVDDFDKSLCIHFKDIEKVTYLKRQFLILGGRSPIADADAQTLYHENRIVFVLKNKKQKVIGQVGKKEEFERAYAIVKKRVEE